MDNEPMIRHWNKVERWLRDEAASCVERGVLPRTVLVAFVDEETALVVDAPEFCDEAADAITDVLCRVTHQIRPDQLLFTRTGVHRTPGSTDELFALRASLFERGRPARHLAHLLLFDMPGARVAAMPQLGVDPHTQRVQRAFNRPEERPATVATEPPPHDDFLIAVPPDGPLGDRIDIPA